MKRDLSRRHTLSLGIFGTLGLLASCGGESSTTAGGTAGSGSDASGGSAGSGGSTGGSGGGAGATGGSGGSGGATGGSGGSGGSTGGSSGSGGTGGTGGSKDGGAGCGMAVVALISGNHGHALSVPPADVEAGAEKVYNTRGTANHDHYVRVTAQDFAALKTGGTVIKRSCNGGDHEYVLSCGTPSRQPAAPVCNEDECGLTMPTICP